jgi:hypothetical protein
MRGLIYKNLLLWHPRRSGNVMICSMAFAISFVALIPSFFSIFVLLALLFALALGTGAGTGVFTADAKNDSLRFLETLPTSRWQVWLANWLNELAVILAATLCLCWYPLLVRPAVFGDPSMRDPLTDFAVSSRFSLPLGVLACAFCYCGITVFVRTFFQEDKTAIIPVAISINLFIVGPAALVVIAELAPTLPELVPLCWTMGLLFSAAAFVSFLVQPREGGRMVFFLAAGVPLMLILFSLEMGILYEQGLKWSALSPHDRIALRDIQVLQGSHPLILANAYTPRSGTHTLLIDPASGGVRKLGRALEDAGDRRSPVEDHRLFWNKFGPDGLIPMSPHLFGISARDGRRTDLPLSNRVSIGPRTYRVRNCNWLAGRNLLVVNALIDQYGPDDNRFAILLMDPAGEMKRMIPSFSYDFGVNKDRLLAKSKGDAGDLLTYCDLSTLQCESTALNGPLLGVSPDLREVLLLRCDPAAGSMRQEMLLLDVETQKVRQLVGPEGFPTLSGAAIADERPFSLKRFPMADSAGRCSYESCAVDWIHRRAVRVGRHPVGERARQFIEEIDLDSGKRKLLVGEEALPDTAVEPDSSSVQTQVRLTDYSADGETIRYTAAGHRWHVGVSGGTAVDAGDAEMRTDVVDIIDYPRVRGSFWIQLTNEKGSNSSSVGILQLHEGEKLRELCRVPDLTYADWLGDDEVLLATDNRLWTVDLSGNTRKVLLDYPSLWH